MRTLVSALLLVSVMTLVNAQTNLSGGSISKDSVWTLAGSPYKVSGSITVNAGYNLVVDSGVVVRFQSGTNLYLNGNLRARQAIFTSSKDTAGGTPARGDWSAIYPNSSTDTLRLDTCTVKFANSNIGSPTIPTNLQLQISSPTSFFSISPVKAGKHTLIK